jgi:small conductance mechanosensitive channel
LTSSIAALITSLGVGVGLAVQGALSNFAGGILIIFTRPFKIDDYIEACGVGGTVEDINLIHTILRTPDNKVITLPNGTLANENIVNYSVKDTRRVDLVFSISYEADFAQAQRLLLSTVAGHELVLADPAPFVRMKEHGDSAIKIAARVWVKSEDYWTVYFDLTERVKAVFDENDIVIPFNQLDVHLTPSDKKAD